MAEEEVVREEGAPEDQDDAELEASEIVTDDKGNKTVSLSTMLRYKKEAKANAKRIKELEPVAGRVTELEGRLNDASPIINAILTNPRLKAEALRIASGTHTTAENREQPDDDPDASSYAEDMGFYLADGVTVDAARARRVLDRLDARHGRQTDAKMRPLAGSFLGSKAEQNLARAIAETDAQGVPYATAESIREVAALMGQDGQHLLANPQVVDLVINNAIGLDRRKGRTPKAPDEPLYLESAGGSRRRAEPSLSTEDRDQAKRLGLDPKYLENAARKLATGKAMRAGKE